MSGKLLLIYICNFHVLNHLLLIYICKFHWNLKNCSNRGDCYYGFCFCDVGYWGEDCSNSSCPGTSCFYEEDTHDQVRFIWVSLFEPETVIISPGFSNPGLRTRLPGRVQPHRQWSVCPGHCKGPLLEIFTRWVKWNMWWVRSFHVCVTVYWLWL